MKFCIILVNGSEVILEAEGVDSLAEFCAMAKAEGAVNGRMANGEALLIPWHAIMGVREAKEERLT